MQTDGRTDRHDKLILAFGNLAKDTNHRLVNQFGVEKQNASKCSTSGAEMEKNSLRANEALTDRLVSSIQPHCLFIFNIEEKTM
jgi:hypothetical protein